VVEDALLTNNDLNATLPYVTLDGSGTVNLLDDTLDFDATVTFVDGPALQSEPRMAGLAGDELPLTIGGTIAEPAIRPNFSALVRARAQEAVSERVQEERAEIDQRLEQEREEVDQRLDQEREEVQERVRDRLRGIFDR